MSAPRGAAVVLVSLLISVAILSSAAWPGRALASASWPVSTGLLVAEVVTGGASASDEYVEIYNAGAATAELGGFELVYVTATGATTTRKALFTAPLPLVPGAHLLVANSAGVYASSADATYTGGLAADGGSLALRYVGGAVIDAVSWGSASNSYVEGSVAPAPPAGSSLERRPGGGSGNWLDTNDNATDWVVRSNPVPQSLASAPVPAPSDAPPATPTPESTASSWQSPTSTSPAPSDEPTGNPSLEPTPAASTGTASPTEGSGSPEPSLPTLPVSPTASPTPLTSSSPTAAPSPTPSEPPIDLESVAAARSQAPGTTVHVAGAVTVSVGLVGADNLFAIADSSGGIFVRLDTAVDGVDVGRSIDIVGVLSAPYGQLEVRELEWLQLGAADTAPVPTVATLPEIGERLEGSLVTVEGTIDSVTTESGRLSITVGDGQTERRVMADPGTGLAKVDVPRGEQVRLVGVVGQRATALGREDGYRLWLRMRSDLTALAAPSPSQTVEPSAGKTVRPTATPTPVAVYHDLATGLAALGRTVDVQATVTAAAGIIDWGGPTIVVDDGTAAVAVVLPDGAASPRVGARVQIAGKSGSLHSGARVVATTVAVLGDAPAPDPLQVAGALGSGQEWQLVTVCGRIQHLTRAGSRWRADLAVGGQTVAVLGEPGAGISTSGIVAGRLALATGIVRRSTSDSSVFQLLPRSAADLVLGPAPAATGGNAVAAAAGQGTDPGATQPPAAGDGLHATVSELPNLEGASVIMAGLIVETGPAGATLDDGTGRVRLGGSAAADALSLLEPGDAIELRGQVARDVDGWLIEVDPDSIVSLAGPGALSAAAASAPGGGLSGGTKAALGAASGGAPAAGDTFGGRGQAHGLAHTADSLVDSDPIQMAVLVGGGSLLIALAGLAALLATRRGVLTSRRWRPAHLIHRR